MSANARTVFLASVAAVVSFALGRVTSESAPPQRAPNGGAHPVTLVTTSPEESLVASAPVTPSSARATVVAEPIDAVVEAQSPSSITEDLRLAEQARLEASLGAYRSQSGGPPPRAKPTLYSWDEAKREMRYQFELNHEDAQYMRDRLFRLDFEFESHGRWHHTRLDARERSGARIASILGELAGVSMLAEPSATRARVLVAECRDALLPLVEHAIDAYEAARFEVWRRELGVIWRDGEPEPRAPQPVERGAFSSSHESAWSLGWRMRWNFDSADHPEFEALLVEIERIKAACVEDITALGQ